MDLILQRRMGSQSSQASSGATTIDGNRFAPVDRLLYKDHIDGLLNDKLHFFADYSTPYVFEIKRSGGGTFRTVHMLH